MRGIRLLAIASAIVLVGCSTDNPAAPVATPVPSAPPSTTPAPSESASPASDQVIAASALLQPADLGGSTLEPLAEGQSEHLRPARPCDARYPSDATRTSAVAMRAQVSSGEGQTPTIVIQYVGRHPGHADKAFDEIAAAVRRCPGGLGEGERQWRTAGEGGAGDESLLLRVSERIEYGGQETTVTTPVVVARVGDYITVVADLGWESAGGDEQRVRQLATTAADRLRAAR